MLELKQKETSRVCLPMYGEKNKTRQKKLILKDNECILNLFYFCIFFKGNFASKRGDVPLKLSWRGHRHRLLLMREIRWEGVVRLQSKGVADGRSYSSRRAVSEENQELPDADTTRTCLPEGNSILLNHLVDFR